MGSLKMASGRQCAHLAGLLKPAFEAAGLTAELAMALAGNSDAIASMRFGVTPVIRQVVADLARCMNLSSRPSCGSLRIGPPEGFDMNDPMKPWNTAALMAQVTAVTKPVPHTVTGYVQQYLLPKITVAQTVNFEEPVEITVGDLGFSQVTTKGVWYPELANNGFEPLVHQEAAFHWAIQYGHTLKPGEWIAVIAPEISDAVGSPRWLSVGRVEHEVFVCNVWANPDSEWSPSCRLLVRRKSAP